MYIIIIIRDGGRGYGGGRRGRLLYTYCYTVTTRMTPALRQAVMRAILMWGTKSQDSVHKPLLLKRKENQSRFEPRSFCLPAKHLITRPNCLNWLTWQASCLFLLTSAILLKYQGQSEGANGKWAALSWKYEVWYCIIVIELIELFIPASFALVCWLGWGNLFERNMYFSKMCISDNTYLNLTHRPSQPPHL